ncbi:MAG: DUF4412 domain-containing protein [Armatimonadota bacterium]
MLRRIINLTTVCTIAIYLLSNCGLSADFSADMVTKMGSTTISGKIYKLGNMIRQDSKMGQQTSTIIIRPDKNKVWLINPQLKRYTELPYDPTISDVSILSNEKELSKIAVKKKLGSEKVNGYDCEKFQLTLKNRQGNTSTIWLARKLQFPIKTQTQTPNGTVTAECKNIKPGAPSGKLFEVPTGYKKVTMQEFHGNPPPPPGTKPNVKTPLPKPKK